MVTRDHVIIQRAKETGFGLRAWLEQRCIPDPETGCLSWRYPLAADGTVRGSAMGMTGLSIRRLVWQVSNDKGVLGKRRPYPTCGNPLCLEPSHQKARTVKEAHRAALKAGSYDCPIARAKRAAAARQRRSPDYAERLQRIKELRAQGMTYGQIGAAVGMDYRCIGKVLRGEKWASPAPAANSSVFAWRPAA